MLELINVTRSYDWPGDTGALSVLKGVSLKVQHGSSIAVVGPSGSGKSTLLNIIGGLDRPTSGRVLLDGKNLAQLSDTQRAKIRSTHIGFIFQLHHLLPQCTVLENVLIPTLAEKNRAKDDAVRRRAHELLQRVGLEDWALHRPGELSGGQRQRVAVVRALINKPKLLLADEPTGSLDSESSENIARLLVELNRSENVTLIAVTHSDRFARHMNQVMELADGRLKDRDIHR